MLELRNISAGYDTGLVLRNVNLIIPDNSVVALLGPNGAGKTTLLRVASGLLKPSSGQLILDGVDMTGKPPEALAKRGIFRALSVADNLRLQAGRGSTRDAISRAVEAFPRLGERLKQTAATMSGGEQQMLALAHAYVSQPAVVLLDEVSMGLAPKIVDEIFVHLRNIAAEGAALLLVEQYIPRALELADYVCILNRGRVRFVGEPGEIGEESVIESDLGDVAS
jgi:branched-chain amino acid transport system ATP-binding protein